MEKITTKKELYIELLKDMYSAEVHEVVALHHFKTYASSQELKELIRNHTGESRMQVLRLEELMEQYDGVMTLEHCRSMQAMIDEAKELVNRCSEGEIQDYAISSSIMRFKQCEIGVYEKLIELATTLSLEKDLELLVYNLREESELLQNLQNMKKAITK